MKSQKPEPKYGSLDHYDDIKGRKYFTYQAKNGLRGAEFNQHFFQPYISKEDALLDFGCGGGFMLKVLLAQKKVGVEINPEAVKMAESLGIQVFHSINEVPGKFDKIISSHALEHVPHPMMAIDELKHKLKDQDSRIILLLRIDDWRAPWNKVYNPDDINMHLYTWTPQLIGNLLKSCGLKIYSSKVVYHEWPPDKDHNFLWNLSHKIFHIAAFCRSLLIKQKQLIAVAGLPS